MWNSQANFLLVELGNPAECARMVGALIEAGIAVKDLRETPGFERCFRVAVGGEVEMERVAAVLAAERGAQV